jgi:hypothetical protein
LKIKQTHPRSNPALTLLKSETGSFAVVMAFCLMLMISALAFALDLGYFVKEKDSYQGCAEAAAMSAAENFCYGRAVEAAEIVAYGSNVMLPDDAVTVEFGFYDSYDEHPDFHTYQDFVAEPGEDEDSDYPTDETNNAVMVTIENTVQSLTGFNKEKKIKARAVAYVPRVSIVSGYRFLSTSYDNLSLNNGNVYSKATMVLKGPVIGGNVNTDAENDDIRIRYTSAVDGPGYPGNGSNELVVLPEIDIIKNHILPLDEYVEKMRELADVTYTPSQSGAGPFYGTIDNGSNKEHYFDLTDPECRGKIIFFDTTGSTGKAMVFLTPHACGRIDYINQPGSKCWKQIGETNAKGNEIKALTFIATCDITIPDFHADKGIIPLGGFDSDQLTIVSTGELQFSSMNNPLKGVNFYCTQFIFGNTHEGATFSPPDPYYLRVITSTGNIWLCSSSPEREEYNFNFKFGPPCPAVVPPTLGRLVLSAE